MANLDREWEFTWFSRANVFLQLDDTGLTGTMIHKRRVKLNHNMSTCNLLETQIFLERDTWSNEVPWVSLIYMLTSALLKSLHRTTSLELGLLCSLLWPHGVFSQHFDSTVREW